MKIRRRDGALVSTDAQAYVKCNEADVVERRTLCGLFRIELYGLADDKKFFVESVSFSLTQGSSLDKACIPLRRMLNELVQSPSVRRIAAAKQLKDLDDVYVTSMGKLIVNQGYAWQELTHEVNAEPGCARQLRRLSEAAKTVGGSICLGKTISAAQWLGFHGLKKPSNVGECTKLLRFLSWSWSGLDQLGNYRDYLDGQDIESVVLTEEDQDDMRRATIELCPRGKSLLTTLYENWDIDLSLESPWQGCNRKIELLVNHSCSQALAEKYIVKLGWYGAAEGETLEPKDLSQFLITAILVELNTLSGSVRKRNCVGAFELYDPVKFAGQPAATIRSGLENYLMTQHGVTRETVALASHLLLAGIAPGLLVNDIPANCTLGSISWVTFNVAVAFVELNAKGTSRFMDFDEIMIFADMDAFSSGMGQLQSLLSVEAIIDWGLVNEVITHEQLSLSGKDASMVALAAYQAFVERLSNSAKIWATAPPDRRETALEALKVAAPGCDFFEDRILRHNTDRLGHSYKMSMLDLHIEGELTSQEWDWRKDGRLYDEYPELRWMKPNQEVFEANAREQYKQLHEALASNIKLAIASMPGKDRDVFERSEISFFTLRPSVAEKRAVSSNVGLVGTNPSPLKPMETQANIDAATGRFGIVMYAAIGSDQYLCYEMFNLRGECRRNDKLGEYIRHYVRVNLPSRLDFNGNLKEWRAAAYVDKYAPVDLECYTHGTAPRPNQTSHAVMDKLGTLCAPASLPTPKRTTYQYYVSPHVGSIAEFIVTHRPLATVEEYIDVLTVFTEREEKRATTDKVVTFIIDLVVPFKSCIEDLASGEKDRVAQGVFGCTMDAVGLISNVLGAVPKALSIAAKTASLTSKLIRALKLGLTFTTSTFNPVGGIPSLGFQLTKKVFRSGLKLGKEGLQFAELATHQLAALTGKADCLDLLKSATLSHIAKGKWRPRGRSIELADVAAVSVNNHWYGANRFGKPWGKRIDFESVQALTLPDVHNVLPASYIHHVIDQSIPAAVQKIDNAITALTSPSRKFNTDSALGIFLGSTPQARDEFINTLWFIKSDFGGLSIKNVLLNPLDNNVNLVEVDPAVYMQWKSAGTTQDTGHEFLKINAKNLNERLSDTGFNYGEIADDLIHEMYLTKPDLMDIVAASTATSGEKGLNVAPLLNLASGCLPMQGDGQGTTCYNKNMALRNADSCALTIALLSQAVTDHPKFVENLGIMTRALQDKAASTEVWVDLNTK